MFVSETVFLLTATASSHYHGDPSYSSMPIPPEQRTRRVVRKPVKLCGSPLKKAKKPSVYAGSRSCLSDEFDVTVRALCKCQHPSLALCHFTGYSDDKDQWLNLNKLSLEAISNIPDVACLSVSPPCPHQLEVKKSRGAPFKLVTRAVIQSKTATLAPASEKGRGERERKRQSGRDRERVRERERERERGRGGEVEIERQRKRKRDRERELDRESSEKETESEKESPLLSPVLGPRFPC